MTRYAASLIIVLLANQAAIATAAAGERIILRDPAPIFGQKHAGQQATQDARMTLVKPLDRVASAVDGAEFEPRQRHRYVASRSLRTPRADAGQRGGGDGCRWWGSI